MGKSAIKVYSYVVEVLVYHTQQGKIEGPRKALADRLLKFKVIARNAREAEHIAGELAQAGGEDGQLLAHASVIECLAGCHQLATR